MRRASEKKTSWGNLTDRKGLGGRGGGSKIIFGSSVLHLPAVFPSFPLPALPGRLALSEWSADWTACLPPLLPVPPARSGQTAMLSTLCKLPRPTP